MGRRAQASRSDPPASSRRRVKSLGPSSIGSETTQSHTPRSPIHPASRFGAGLGDSSRDGSSRTRRSHPSRHRNFGSRASANRSRSSTMADRASLRTASIADPIEGAAQQTLSPSAEASGEELPVVQPTALPSVSEGSGRLPRRTLSAPPLPLGPPSSKSSSGYSCVSPQCLPSVPAAPAQIAGLYAPQPRHHAAVALDPSAAGACMMMDELLTQFIHLVAEGTYSASSGLKSADECEVCPIAHYCPLGSADAPTIKPIPCGEGRYGETTGLDTTVCSGLCNAGAHLT